MTIMMMTTMMTMMKIMTTTMATNTPSNGSLKPQLRQIAVFQRPFALFTKISFYCNACSVVVVVQCNLFQSIAAQHSIVLE